MHKQVLNGGIRVTVNTLYSLSVFKLRQQQFFVVRIDDAYKPGSHSLHSRL